jgi:LPS sulfotransferase NodH/transposase-like protein
MRKALIIATEVRSGSTFIAESIAYHFNGATSCGFFDLTKEHFGYLNAKSSSGEILAKFKSLYTNQCGWAATKILCAALSIIVREARKDEALKQEFFGPNTYWVIVRRRRKVLQAVSLAYAKRTGDWHVYAPEEGSGNKPVVQFNDTEEALRAILLSDTFLETFSNLIANDRKIEVYYEDFLEQPDALISRLYDLLGVDRPAEGLQYKNETKLIPTAVEAKRQSVSDFHHWFLENYYAEEKDSLSERLATSGNQEAHRETNDFRRGIVDAALNKSRSIQSLAREHGIERKLIRYWITKHDNGELDENMDGGEKEQLLLRRISELEEELKELKRLAGGIVADG